MPENRGTFTKMSSPSEANSPPTAAVRPSSRTASSSTEPKRKLKQVTAMPPKRGVRFLPTTL